MRLEAFCETDVGLKREKNQDSFLIDPDLGLFLVADGMGGHKGGEVASKLAAEHIQTVIRESIRKKDRQHPRELLQNAYIRASSAIYDMSSRETDLRGMGTTVVTVFFHDGIFYIANVGDSRAYLLRGEYSWQVTEDHSLIYEQIKAGLWSEKDEESFPAKNVITRSVGFEKKVACDILERQGAVGDKILLCSDGLSGLVRDKKVAEILTKHPSQNALRLLMDEAKKNGGDDNITALTVSVLNE